MHENGKSRSSVEVFCLTVRKTFLGTTSKFQAVWDLDNFYAHNGFPSIFFCLTVPNNFVRKHLVFQKVSNVRYRKKKMQLNGMSRFSVENFPSQGAEIFRCGTLWYIRKVRPSKNFMSKRLITLFSVEFFFTYTASKVRWRTPLCFRIFGISKTFMFSRESAIFRRFFGLPVLKNLVANPFSLTEHFVIETFYA